MKTIAKQEYRKPQAKVVAINTQAILQNSGYEGPVLKFTNDEEADPDYIIY